MGTLKFHLSGHLQWSCHLSCTDMTVHQQDQVISSPSAGGTCALESFGERWGGRRPERGSTLRQSFDTSLSGTLPTSLLRATLRCSHLSGKLDLKNMDKRRLWEWKRRFGVSPYLICKRSSQLLGGRSLSKALGSFFNSSNVLSCLVSPGVSLVLKFPFL